MRADRSGLRGSAGCRRWTICSLTRCWWSPARAVWGNPRSPQRSALRRRRRGKRVIVAEVAARHDVSQALGAPSPSGPYSEHFISERLHHISIDPQHAMEEYLRQQLPVGALAAPLTHNRIFTALTAATPGMRELLAIGKVWELAQPERRTRRAQPYDLVVLDAPATGHGVAMLQAPQTFASVARVGPVASEGRAVASFLSDPRRTALVAVSTAEEMPVTETLDLQARVREELGLDSRSRS